MKHGTILAALAAFSAISTAHAQNTGVKPAPTTAMQFAKAGETWASVLADKKLLDTAIRQNKLDDVHELAFSIRDAVVTLPYKSAPLPAAKRAALLKQVEIVAALADALDKSGDAHNTAQTKTEYKKLTTVLSAIESLYPANTLPTGGTKPLTTKERALFLTPGGLYTLTDIRANGYTSVYRKFPDFVTQHTAQVKKGERVCPISETQPNPDLKWIIGGKAYTFCCPPCVAEFVSKAKTAPTSIKSPESYVKK